MSFWALLCWPMADAHVLLLLFQLWMLKRAIFLRKAATCTDGLL